MRMTAFVPTLLLAWLAGCAAPAPKPLYGNFVQSAPAALNQRIADDAVKQLVSVYPPARTRFELQHDTPDPFGALLADGLRTKGYALLEYTPSPAQAKAVEQAQPLDQAAKQPASLPLRYVVDQAGGSNLYRLTLLVGAQRLTRAYMTQDDQVNPAGAWARKE